MAQSLVPLKEILPGLEGAVSPFPLTNFLFLPSLLMIGMSNFISGNGEKDVLGIGLVS